MIDDLMLSISLSFSLPLSLFPLSPTHLEVPALAHGIGHAVEERRVGGGSSIVSVFRGRFQGDGRRGEATPAVEARRRGGRKRGRGERSEGGEEEEQGGGARHVFCFESAFCYCSLWEPGEWGVLELWRSEGWR